MKTKNRNVVKTKSCQALIVGFFVAVSAVSVGIALYPARAFALKLDNKTDRTAWAPTGLTAMMLDNTITVEYCKYELKRFLGCVAGVEQFAQFVTPKSTLHFIDRKFVVQKNDHYWSLNGKQEVSARRENYNQLKNGFTPSGLESLVSLYNDLRKSLPNPAPHQVGLSLNEASAVMYDPHSLYLPASRYNGLNFITQKPSAGFAVQKENQAAIVTEVLVGSSAELSGLKIDDVILGINGKTMALKTEEELESLFDFPNKTKVKLQVKRDSRIFEMQVVFSYEPISRILNRVIPAENKKIAYLSMAEIPSDLGVSSTCNVFRDSVFKKVREDSDALILDFRNNPGGAVDVAVCFVNMLIGKDLPVVLEMDLSDIELKIVSSNYSKVYEKPLVVLVNGQTASAAEMIADALKFYGRGLIIGDRTFGKSIGQLQQSYNLDVEKKLVQYSTDIKMYNPGGVSYHGKGVNPDILIYRQGLTPSLSEINQLREEDIALFALRFDDVKAAVVKPKPIHVPSDCLRPSAIISQTQSLSDTSWLKDIQLQVGIQALLCQLRK